MPCDSYVTISIELKAANRDLLSKAAKSIGMTMISKDIIQTAEGRTMVISGDKVQCDRRDEGLVAKLRVSYSNEVVKFVSQKFGWQRQVKGANKFLLRKGI